MHLEKTINDMNLPDRNVNLKLLYTMLKMDLLYNFVVNSSTKL